MDIYPTLLNKCGIYYSKSNIRGKDLFGEEYHNELLLEDHTSFYATILDSVNCWGVVQMQEYNFAIQIWYGMMD